jgi:hypothetical protein
VDAAEVDLGVRWSGGKFQRTGAALLDDGLVNDPLRWLADPRHKVIRDPFRKALDHLLESRSRTELRADVMTDMYEALEATVKLVTGRDRDLSGNMELFVSTLNAPAAYRDILRPYLTYANRFRHGATTERPTVSEAEAESFLYLSGLFIRMALTSGTLAPGS